MSTLKVAAINNPSASSGGLAISASGNVTGAGLDLITTQSFSAVSSVSVNGCFSGDYDNYRVLVNVTAASAGSAVNLRLRASGTDLATAYYYAFGTDVIGGTTYNSVTASNDTKIEVSYANSTSTYSVLDIVGPNLAQKTFVTGSGANAVTTGNFRTGGGFANNTTAYDGFSLSVASGSFDGTVSVYGYKK